jgi:hypothetical protein
LNFSLKPYSHHLSFRLTRGLLALASLSAACAPRSKGEATATTAQGERNHGACRPIAHTEPPSLPPPHPVPPARSGELWLSIDVPLAVIEREFEKQVPKTLAAEEHRPIGAPGEVTYRVTRGKSKLRATDGRLTATLPVNIELSLCKPFGSLCIGYGSCSPAYDVKATWDLTLGADHELPDVRLSQKVTEKCSVGIDVTEHVTRVVTDQLREAEARIDREMPPLAPWVDRAIAEMTRPSLLRVGQCVALSPTELLLDGPKTDGARLTFSVGLVGTIEDAACDAPPHRGRGLPVRRAKRERDGARLEVREHLPAEKLAEPLGLAVKSASSAELALALRDYALVEDGLLLEVELSGHACGTVWISSSLGVVGDRLSLQNSKAHASALTAEQTANLEAALTRPLDVESAVPRWLEDRAIEERTDILGTLLAEQAELELEVQAPKVRGVRALPADDGIWLTTEVDSELTLSVTSPGASSRAPKP